MNEQTIIQNRKYNVKLFPFYKALSWDLLFYYAVSFLFLTQIKGLSAAEVLFLDAFYPIFKFIFQIPSTILVNKFGNRKSLIIGNLFVSGSILAIILGNSMAILIFSQLLSAIGYVLKGLTETNLLYDSIEHGKKRNDLFALIDGKGSSFYYYIDAITSLTTGFLFVFNGYIPMVICFFLCLLSTILSLKFKDVIIQKNRNNISIKTNLKDIKDRI